MGQTVEMWRQVQPWVKRIDWALVLAALVEIPRWSVAFLAIHEPWVFGVPLAVIIAWSMKAGWSRYFRKGGRLILTLNTVALVIATVIITPVLYLMTNPAGVMQIGNMQIPQVNIADFPMPPDPVLLIWSLALALGTFLPLISLSAVRAAEASDQTASQVHQVEQTFKVPVPTAVVLAPAPVNGNGVVHSTPATVKRVKST